MLRTPNGVPLSCSKNHFTLILWFDISVNISCSGQSCGSYIVMNLGSNFMFYLGKILTSNKIKDEKNYICHIILLHRNFILVIFHLKLLLLLGQTFILLLVFHLILCIVFNFTAS